MSIARHVTQIIHNEEEGPVDFDLGLITAFTRKFVSKVRVIHGVSCRKDGAGECQYTVTWR